SVRVQACGYVDSRKALRVGEYSDVCRGGLEQQFLKRADARVANCVTNTAESLKKNGEVFTSPVRSAFYCETLLLLFIELYAISKVYILSANTIMPVAVVGVVPITTISPTARRG